MLPPSKTLFRWARARRVRQEPSLFQLLSRRWRPMGGFADRREARWTPPKRYLGMYWAVARPKPAVRPAQRERSAYDLLRKR